MKHTYTPELCAQENAEYTGQLTLEMPNFSQRLAMIEELDELATVYPSDSDEVKTKKNMKRLRYRVDALPAAFVASSITRVKDGFVFDTWEKISYESALAKVITEAANVLIGDYSVGSPS